MGWPDHLAELCVQNWALLSSVSFVYVLLSISEDRKPMHAIKSVYMDHHPVFNIEKTASELRISSLAF